MNSTDFYIKAGEAICEWGKNYNGPCFLETCDGIVVACGIEGITARRRSPLYISAREIRNGMKAARWNEIGAELYNLYCKELACQTNDGKSK